MMSPQPEIRKSLWRMPPTVNVDAPDTPSGSKITSITGTFRRNIEESSKDVTPTSPAIIKPIKLPSWKEKVKNQLQMFRKKQENKVSEATVEESRVQV